MHTTQGKHLEQCLLPTRCSKHGGPLPILFPARCNRQENDPFLKAGSKMSTRPSTPPSSGFPHGSVGKESTYYVGDLGLIPGLGRSPGGGHGNPLQYPCPENPQGQRTWGATVHWVAKSQTRLSASLCFLHFKS